MSHGVLQSDSWPDRAWHHLAINHGVIWHETHKGYGPRETINHLFVRQSSAENRFFAEAVFKAGLLATIKIDATHYKPDPPPPRT